MDRAHTFAGSPLDRASARRADAAWLLEARRAPGTRWLTLRELRAPVSREGPPRLVWREPPEVETCLKHDPTVIFLGLRGEVAHFALDGTPRSTGEAPGSAREEDSGGEGVEWVGVRTAASLLPADEAGILAQARSLVDWHLRHPCCAECGGSTTSAAGGYERTCTNSACGARHFPRTDPVVIVHVHRGDHCLLGRSLRPRRFRPGLFSCLAGYVEPGENLEEAVRREVVEETGVRVGHVRYHSSQPWPFPSTLMIGFFAEGLTDRVRVDPLELEEARWFSRDEAAVALARWRESDGIRLPPPFTIAHQMVRAWLEDERGAGER